MNLLQKYIATQPAERCADEPPVQRYFSFVQFFFVLLHSLVFNVTSLQNIENNYEGLFDCGCVPLFATAFS